MNGIYNVGSYDLQSITMRWNVSLTLNNHFRLNNIEKHHKNNQNMFAFQIFGLKFCIYS